MKKIVTTLMAFVALCASAIAQITAPAVEQRPDTDQKYLAGAVLEHDNYAYITRTIDVPTDLTQAEVLKRLGEWLQRCIKDDRVLFEQALPQPADNELMHGMLLRLTFSQSFLSHDFSDMSYVIHLTVNPGKVVMDLERITYKYREGDAIRKFSAEEMITDKEALNKKGRLILGYKRFRIKTIDFADELAASLQKEFQ